MYPLSNMMRAMALMPMPPMPTKCTCFFNNLVHSLLYFLTYSTLGRKLPATSCWQISASWCPTLLMLPAPMVRTRSPSRQLLLTHWTIALGPLRCKTWPGWWAAVFSAKMWAFTPDIGCSEAG